MTSIPNQSNVPAVLGQTGGIVMCGGRVPLFRSSLFQNSGPSSGTQSNGTDNSFNSVTHHEFVGKHVNEIQAVYVNPSTSGNAPITITAAAQSPTSGGVAIYPLTFGGASSAVLNPGSYLISDPMPVWDQVVSGFWPTQVGGPPFTKPGPFSGFTNIFIRTHGVVASGKWEMGYTYYGLSGEQYESGTSLADKSQTNTAVATPSAGAFMFGPALVLTTSKNHLPIVLGLGDSIAAGQGDTTGGGFIERACAATSVPTPMLKAALGGTSPPYLALPGGALPPSHRNGLVFALGGTHAICEGGINFGGSFTYNQATEQMWRDWQALSEIGYKVYQTTLTPHTTSTDSWATTGNQTAVAGETIRQQLNTWIRTTPSPLTGYIEVANQVESAQNSGLWKAPGYTADGLHPTATGHTAIATTLGTTVAAFTVS